VAPDADAATIRAAYRRRAQVHHPDRVHAERGAPSTPDEMAAINEAYRVLGDPARRIAYDRGLRPDGAGGRASARVPEPETRDGSAHLHAGRSGLDAVPARMPWRLLGGIAGLGIAVVIAGAIFIDPPAERAPDGILRSGSCVALEVNGDAREVACTGDDDLVVSQLVPIDARCPVGTAAHRDRLGLGTACVVGPPDG
jgi:curved DNA-binding protein CbpA